MNERLWIAATRDAWMATFYDRFVPLSQSWEWGEAKRMVGHKVERMMLNGNVGVQFESRRGVAWAPAGPLGDLGENAGAALSALSRSISRPILLSPIVPLPGFGEPLSLGLFHSGTVVFPCGGDDAAWLSRLRGSWKRNLSKGERSGAQVVDGSVDDLMDMLEELADRKGFDLAYDAAFIGALARSFGSGFVIRVARLDGRTLGGRLDLRTGGTATSFLSATTLEGRSCGASYLLTWDTLRLHREAGAVHYDLGGIGSDRTSGTGGHKISMGGEVLDFPGTYLVGSGPRAIAVKSFLGFKRLDLRWRGKAPTAE